MTNQTNKFTTSTLIANNGPYQTNWGKGSAIVRGPNGDVIGKADIVNNKATYKRILKAADMGQHTIGITYTGDHNYTGGAVDTFTNHVGGSKVSNSPYVTQIVAGPGLFVGPSNGKGTVVISTQPIPSKNINEDLLSISWTITNPNLTPERVTDQSQFTIGGTNGLWLRSRDGTNFVNLMSKINSNEDKHFYSNIHENITLQSNEFGDAGVVYWHNATLISDASYYPFLISHTPQDIVSTGTVTVSLDQTDSHYSGSIGYFGNGTAITLLNASSDNYMKGTVSAHSAGSLSINVTSSLGQGNFSYWQATIDSITRNLNDVAQPWGRVNNGGLSHSNAVQGDGVFTLGSPFTYLGNGLSNEIVQSSGCYYQPSIQPDFASTLFLTFTKNGGIYRATHGIPCLFDDSVGGGISPDNTIARELTPGTYHLQQSSSDCTDSNNTNFTIVVADRKIGAILYSNRTANGGSSWQNGNITLEGITSNIVGIPMYASAYGNNQFIVAGDNDIVYLSQDGISWTVTETGWLGTNWRNAAYGNGTFVLVGQAGRIAYSNDNGVTWTKSPFMGGINADGAVQNLNAVSYSPDLDTFVAVGDGYSIIAFGSDMLQKPVNIDGVTPETPLGTKSSKFALIASSTQSVYGSTIVLKALSDAAYQKTVPVEFFSTFTTESTTTLLTLGTGTWVNTTDAPLVLTTLDTGTHNVFAVWPGEDKFAPTDTTAKPITITVAPGYDIGGIMTINITPNDNTLVEGEGTATIFVSLTTSTLVSGNIQFYADNEPLGTLPIINNSATLAVDNLIAGTYVISAAWPGGIINNLVYEGKSTSTNYTILAGSVLGTPVELNVIPDHGIYLEKQITLIASWNTTTVLAGTATFYANNIQLYSAPIYNNSSTVVIPNTYPVGTSTFKVEWDGNAYDHPRFLPQTSSTNWTVYSRETITNMVLDVNPNPSANIAHTNFKTTFTSPTNLPGTVTFLLNNSFLGRADIINNVASFTTSTISTGTYIASSYYAGSSTTPKYFPATSNTLTLTVSNGYLLEEPIVLTYTTPDIVNENITFSTDISTSTNLSGSQMDFYVDNVRVGYGLVNFNANNNHATTTTTIATTGTHNIQAKWSGGTLNNGHYYSAKSSTVSTITVVGGRDISGVATLVLTSDAVNPGSLTPIRLTATLTTSTQFNGINSGIITFKDISTATARILATGTFVNNIVSATIAAGVISVGTSTLQAVWAGQNVAPRYYGLTSNTLTQHVHYVAATNLNLYVTTPNLVDSLPTTKTNNLYTYYNKGTSATNNTMVAKVVIDNYNTATGMTGTFELRDYFRNLSIATTSTVDYTNTSTSFAITPTRVYIDPLQNEFGGQAPIYVKDGLRWLEFTTNDKAKANNIIQQTLPTYYTKLDRIVIYTNGQRFGDIPNATYNPESSLYGYQVYFNLIHANIDGTSKYYLEPMLDNFISNPKGLGNDAFPYSISQSYWQQGVTPKHAQDWIGDIIFSTWSSLTNVELRVEHYYPTVTFNWDPANFGQYIPGQTTSTQLIALYTNDYNNADAVSSLNTQYSIIQGANSTRFNSQTPASLQHSRLTYQSVSNNHNEYVFWTLNMYGGIPPGEIKLYSFNGYGSIPASQVPAIDTQSTLLATTTATSNGTAVFPGIKLPLGTTHVYAVTTATTQYTAFRGIDPDQVYTYSITRI